LPVSTNLFAGGRFGHFFTDVLQRDESVSFRKPLNDLALLDP